MIINLVKKYLKARRGDPLNVTVSEAELLHDFATWVDQQPAQKRKVDELSEDERLAGEIGKLDLRSGFSRRPHPSIRE